MTNRANYVRVPHTDARRAASPERIIERTEEDLKLLEGEVEKARERRIESDSAAQDELYAHQEWDHEMHRKYYEGFHEYMEIGEDWRKFHLL